MTAILGPDFLPDFQILRRANLSWRVALILGLAMFIVMWLFDRWGIATLSLPFLFSILSLNLVITIKWQLRTYNWFRVMMVVLAALHAPLVFYPPFQGYDDKDKLQAYASLSGIDVVVMLVILSLANKYVGSLSANEGAKPPRKELS